MKKLIIPLLLLCYADGSGAQIYKWVDANGTAHFSDSPPPGDSAEEVELDGQPSEQAVQEAQEAQARRLQYQRADSEARHEEEARRQEIQDLERQEAELQSECANARQQLAVLEMQLPVYRENDAGERVYLEDDDRASEQAQLTGQIAQHCD